MSRIVLRDTKLTPHVNFSNFQAEENSSFSKFFRCLRMTSSGYRHLSLHKRLVKLIQRVKITHTFLLSMSNLFHALYHFKLADVVLRMAVKEFFEIHLQKWRYRLFLIGL